MLFFVHHKGGLILISQFTARQFHLCPTYFIEVDVLHADVLHHCRFFINVWSHNPERRAALLDHACNQHINNEPGLFFKIKHLIRETCPGNSTN